MPARRLAVRGTGRRDGFTMLEMLAVMVLGAILASIVAPSIGSVQARMETRSSRDAFIRFAARARSAAMERGTVTTLTLDPDAGSARLTQGTEVLDSVRFDDLGIQLHTSTGQPVVVCYSSRGFALASCTQVAADVEVDFIRAGTKATARVQPLGQVRKVGA